MTCSCSDGYQINILERIGQKETVVGIIGDKAQSIYSFQGADPSQFQSFSLDGLVDYIIEPNRRSTNKIIDVLNYIRRKDIIQTKFRNIDGEKPKILIGRMENSLRRVKNLCAIENVYSLSRNNITSNAMKREINGEALKSNLFNKLLDLDKPSRSNHYRSLLVVSCIKSIELAREGKFKESIRILEKALRKFPDKSQRKRKALEYVSVLLGKYDDYKNLALLDFYNVVKENLDPKVSKLTDRGKAKPFYESNSYQEMAMCVQIPEDVSQHKTIHKAKGDQFDTVLVVLLNENDLNFLLDPNLLGNNLASEEHRIYYVAASRAVNNLFISVPSLSSINQQKLITIFDFEKV